MEKDNKGRRKRVSGIYSIVNKVNSKRYIGLSISIHDRWDNHLYDLRKDNHVNPYLQNAWNKHGEDNFSFEILELCDKNVLEEREIYWIDKFDSCNTGYNILYGSGDYSNLKRTTSGKKEYDKPFYIFNRYSREFLGEYNRIDDVTFIYDISYYAAKDVLTQKAGYVGAFELIYKDDYENNGGKLFSELNRGEGDKGFYIVDLMTGEHKHFYHVQHGASYFGIPDESVIQRRLSIEKTYPVWNGYWIGSWYKFDSMGSVQNIIDKYSRWSYMYDCGLEGNL